MGKTVQYLPFPDGNDLIILEITDKTIKYKRSFNIKHVIKEDYIIKDGILHTYLIHVSISLIKLDIV